MMHQMVAAGWDLGSLLLFYVNIYILFVFSFCLLPIANLYCFCCLLQKNVKNHMVAVSRDLVSFLLSIVYMYCLF